jgi:transcriptional regulator with XRE-family HTH domain
MQANSLKDKINLSHAKALRQSRELVKVTRLQLAQRLNLSPKTIEKYESGRAIIDDEKIQSVLRQLELKREDYEKIRKGKGIGLKRKQKSVLSNTDRRSYMRIITKEVRVLKILRQMKNLSQDQASAICGYSRPSIGHIENGRITLDQNRIQHILHFYGYSVSEFDRLMREEILRDEIIKEAIAKMNCLSEEKLKIVSSLLKSL